MVPRDFASSREVYLTFAMPQGSAEGTALAKGRLSPAGNRLENVEVIFEMTPGSSGGRHFAAGWSRAPTDISTSRSVTGATGPRRRTCGRHNGSVIRIARDGSVPPDNPFVGQAGAAPEIYSYGHRNPQGLAVAPDGTIWTVEHGARGGDEVNIVRPGANYGWPVISYGRHYSGARIGEGTEKPGMEQPEFHWDPSIAPSGLMVYSGALWPEWEGDLFTGSLNSDFISGSTPKEVCARAERIEGVRNEPGPRHPRRTRRRDLVSVRGRRCALPGDAGRCGG